MRVIGLTGGIATGKSTVSNIAMEFGIPLIDADKIAREIVEVGKPAFHEIVSTFGEKIVKNEGILDRKRLGQLVFNDKKALEKLNHITHPRIIDEINKRIEELSKSGEYSVIILDAALLIEMDMKKLVDEIWLVIAEVQTQIKRIMKRDGFNKKEAILRIESQMTSNEKFKYADVIIENNGDYEMLRNKVKIEIDRVYNNSGGI